MGWGGLDGPLTLGTRALVWMALLNTELLWTLLCSGSCWFTAMNPEQSQGTSASWYLSELCLESFIHLPLLDSRETSGSLPAFVNRACKDNVCKTKQLVKISL